MGAQLSFEAINQQAAAHLQIPAQTRISELYVPGNSAMCRHMLPAVLTSLCAQNDPRWLCWVANMPVKALLDDNQKNNPRVLQVVAQTDLVSLAERALASGRSHTVVLAIGRTLLLEEQTRLESAASAGNSELMLLR